MVGAGEGGHGGMDPPCPVGPLQLPRLGFCGKPGWARETRLHLSPLPQLWSWQIPASICGLLLSKGREPPLAKWAQLGSLRGSWGGAAR